jgi:hypothetical protein
MNKYKNIKKLLIVYISNARIKLDGTLNMSYFLKQALQKRLHSNPEIIPSTFF